MADEYCEALGHKHYVKVTENHYDSIPVETRGIPHLAIPGLHAFLDELYDGMQTLRSSLSEVVDFSTVQSIACLPFTPFAQALAPGTTHELDQTSGFAFRNRADQIDLDGRCFLIDSTVEDIALLKEPLFPRPQIVDASDNPFESADDHMETFFNAASTIALLIKTNFGAIANDLGVVRQTIECFAGIRPSCVKMHVAADIAVLVNACYPTVFGVARPHILAALARAPSMSHRAAKRQQASGKQVEGLRLTDMGLSATEVSKAQHYLSVFTEFVLADFGKLVSEFMVLDGRYDLSVAQHHKMHHLLCNAVRAAWWFASPDPFNGMVPDNPKHPLYNVAAPSLINSRHVNMIIVDRENTDDGTWTNARGALVGMTPGGYRQLLSLLIAASAMDVEVQVHRNVGGLLLRPSAAPDILTEHGKPRSDKAISPLGVEGDALSWGSREGKLRNCKRQRAAWKTNLRALMPLCVEVRKPLPGEERLGADSECVQFLQQQAAAHSKAGTKTREELEALNEFQKALSK